MYVAGCRIADIPFHMVFIPLHMRFITFHIGFIPFQSVFIPFHPYSYKYPLTSHYY
jgi:hypothetical protein